MRFLFFDFFIERCHRVARIENIIDDEDMIRDTLEAYFESLGWTVFGAHSGEDALEILAAQAPDAAIVDIMLPGMDGLTLVEKVRHDSSRHTPIIFLSARREVDDRVRGLQVGGDDYLVKPFAFSELVARLQALIRRTAGVREPVRLTHGDLELDVARRRLTRAGQSIELQPREFALLQYLLYNPGRVVSKTMIMEHVWDYNFDPETNVVETCVCRLRNKLNEGFSEKREYIRTIRGVGYVLSPLD